MTMLNDPPGSATTSSDVQSGWWIEPRPAIFGTNLTIWKGNDVRGVVSILDEEKEEIARWKKMIEQLNSKDV